MILNSEKIANLRVAGEKLVAVLEKIKAEIKSGTNLQDIARLAENEIKRHGGLPSFQGYQGYPSSICLSVNDQIVHCPPSDTTLRDGDVISVDLGLYYKGVHADAAFTWPVGQISPNAKRLLAGTYAALLAGTSQVKPGAKVNDISSAIEKMLKAKGLTIFRQFVGHGVGAQLHEEPMIPNFSTPGRTAKLVPGMAIALEPIAGLGEEEVITEADDWSTRSADGKPAAHFEHTVLVTDTGYEVITPLGTLIGSPKS